MRTPNTKKKIIMKHPLNSVEVRVAKSIAEVIVDSVKDLPKHEQTRRIKTFCDALDDFLQLHASTSSSPQSG